MRTLLLLLSSLTISGGQRIERPPTGAPSTSLYPTVTNYPTMTHYPTSTPYPTGSFSPTSIQLRETQMTNPPVILMPTFDEVQPTEPPILTQRSSVTETVGPLQMIFTNAPTLSVTGQTLWESLTLAFFTQYYFTRQSLDLVAIRDFSTSFNVIRQSTTLDGRGLPVTTIVYTQLIKYTAMDGAQDPLFYAIHPFEEDEQSIAYALSLRVLPTWETVFTLIGGPRLMPPTPPPTGFPTMPPPPTVAPTTAIPTGSPTVTPTGTPTHEPTTAAPTPIPTAAPTFPLPTAVPTAQPTTGFPTGAPTYSPTGTPTSTPTGSPISAPTGAPATPTPETLAPAPAPTASPTASPTAAPTSSPTAAPTASPTPPPTARPTPPPTASPTDTASAEPTLDPTGVDDTPRPTATASEVPSGLPSVAPSVAPSTLTGAPTTPLPSDGPSAAPSEEPTPEPGQPVDKNLLGLKLELLNAGELLPTEQSGWEAATEQWFNNFFQQQQRRRLEEVGPKDLVQEMFTSVEFLSSVVETDKDGIRSNTITYNQRLSYLARDGARPAEEYAVLPFGDPAANIEYGNVLRKGFTNFNLVALPVSSPRVPDQTSVSGAEGGEPIPQDKGLGMPMLIGIILAGVAVVAVLGYVLYGALRGRDQSQSFEPTAQFHITSDEDVSTIDDPYMRAASGRLKEPARMEGGYGDQSVSTVDYDYSKAYGGGDTSVVSSAGGTMGDATRQTADAALAATALGAERDSHEHVMEIIAPAGKLGVVIDTPDDGAPVVHAVKDTSVIAGQIQVGDKLIAVDEEDVRSMTAIRVSKLISKKSANAERKLTIIRTSLLD